MLVIKEMDSLNLGYDMNLSVLVFIWAPPYFPFGVWEAKENQNRHDAYAACCAVSK